MTLSRTGRCATALAVLLAAPLAAQTYAYARTMTNDPALCTSGKGPAVQVMVSGLKSSSGNLFVRVYPARASDWLQSKRYVLRVDARPQKGSTMVCVPLPAAGEFAIAVEHDANGNRRVDLSGDGAGMSNNPKVKRVLGIVPKAPTVDQTRFTAGAGITRMTIAMKYL